MSEHILVIKLGALGDFVQAFGPFAAIRAHHPGAEITLLTTRPFASLATASPWFDQVWIDDKPKMWQVAKVLKLKKQLLSGHFDRVYDLQTSDRSSSYFHLMGGEVAWSGIASGCSMPHANPARDHMHTIDRQAEQLAMAGIDQVPPADLSWADGDISRFGLPAGFVLICPGGSPHRPAKRWPARHFATLADRLVAQGRIPVLLGTDAEKTEIADIRAACPAAISLAGKTSFADILALGRQAAAAIGNDTGPMHLVAATGCPALVLFSGDSNPTLCAPRGHVVVVQRPDLGQLDVDPVWDVVAPLLSTPPCVS